MAARVVMDLLQRTSALDPNEIDDLILGCALPEAEQGANMARIVAMRAGLPVSVAGMTINRFCSSGLQAIALAAERIRSGGASVILAGGAESMSLMSRDSLKPAPNPTLVDTMPEIYITMGLTAENVVKKFNISREEQDIFSYFSHQKALTSQTEGKFKDELVPLDLEFVWANNDTTKKHKMLFEKDEGIRADTNIEKLASLKPVFHAHGTVTAGNSSQTSDGAALALVMSETKATAMGLKPIARFVSFATSGVPPEIMGIGPVLAIPKALKLAGLSLDDIGIIELNEAFAGQALAVIKEAGLNADITNVNGGAIALGHPLGATGAKLTATILHEMGRRSIRYGMVTMCVGGGQGAAAIFERIH
tara:strand:- start:154286 stop:155377 length:1092 start_codon:yes stop_codon:yes gene_type:complete